MLFFQFGRLETPKIVKLQISYFILLSLVYFVWLINHLKKTQHIWNKILLEDSQFLCTVASS